MKELIIVIVALLPVLVLWFYIWRKDPHPEPTSQLLKAIAVGALICIPVAFVEVFVDKFLFGDGIPYSVLDTTIEAFFVAALPEEGCKLLALWFILRKNRYFDEHFDGIVYAVCVSLGFAAVENVFYLFGNLEDWKTVAIGRALLAVPGHYAFAVLMGYYYSIHHFVNHSFKAGLRVLLIPILAHGLYDAIALCGQVDPYLGGLGFLGLVYFCFKLHRYCAKVIIQLIEFND